MPAFTLDDLERVIAERAKADPADSWTARLLAGGPEKPAKKMGEEAIETVIAAVGEDRDALVRESADLVYHWMVVLAAAGIPLSDVLAELERRTRQSGLAEKASRTSGR